ncbi:neural Wiskott-Aldrich syndrome protein-like isoform X2 [Dermochelys coriacea]|uniref:neural Wiskott-Aldrich syndrome protein-like isoform X2 n=1 Tax=Dermochelys coriacea TaxID=27794 RepID=UPI0018E6F86E|nr:neural Wiskott-Aldrich syndrome protein-like isoform X2 [Dermochelys coriacea]
MNMAFLRTVAFLVPVFEMPSPLPVPQTSLTSPEPGISPPPSYVSQTTKERIKWKGKPKRNKINKDDISYPSNFKHLGHVGWNSLTGFTTILDSDLKKLAIQVGVTEDHLNKRTSEKIFKTIERKGGIEAVRKEVQMRATSSRSSSPLLLHSTSSSEQSSTISPSIELNSPVLRADDGLKAILLAPPSTSKALLPPWNVPSVVIAPAPPMPSPSKRASPMGLCKQTLSLRGPQLHKIKTEKTPTTLHQNDLMGQIRKGIQLKSVTLTPTSPQSPNDGGLVAALKDVIQKRYKALDSSGEETRSENEEEWKD